MAKHFCHNCGIEYDPSESMCPACGYKNETIKEEKKTLKPLVEKREKHREPIDKKKEVPAEKRKKSVLDSPSVKTDRDKKDAFYRGVLEKLERSLHTGKKVKEKAGSLFSGVKKVCAVPVNILFLGQSAYILWFVTGLSVFSSLAGYKYSAFSWYEESLLCYFTSDRILHAEFTNVHHNIDRLISPGSFHIIHADVHLSIVILSCFIPVILWFIKMKAAGMKKSGDPNVLAAIIITLILVIPVFILLRILSFEYIIFDIILGISMITPLLGFGIFPFLSSSESLKPGKTLTLILYNCAIPIIFLVINMFFDYVS
jgi:uncharacterized Zn finger protein (UPF0148 family)